MRTAAFVIGFTTCTGLAILAVMLNRDIATQRAAERGEWTGPIETMPYMWKQVGDRRLTKLTFGNWDMYEDIDDHTLFGDNGVQMKRVDDWVCEAVDGSVNIFTGKTHHNSVTTITFGEDDPNPRVIHLPGTDSL